MIFKSIRSRLLAWLGLLLVCILTGFGVTAYRLYGVHQFNQLDEALVQRVQALTSDVRRGPGPGPPPSNKTGRPPLPPPEDRSQFGHGPGPRESQPDREIRLSSQVLNLFDESGTNGFYFAVWSREGDLLTVSSGAPSGILYPKGEYGSTRTHLRTRGTLREAFHFTERSHCILVGRSVLAELNASRRFGWWLAGIGAAILALGLGGSGLLVSRTLRPVNDISMAAKHISEGNLSERIKVPETDSELGRLAGVLNATFARLEAAFAEQKQFTADASHELRTPLAVLISEAQTTLARERSPAEYRAAVEECLETAQQMRKMTESLLQLARLDAGQEIIQTAEFDLVETTLSSVKRLRPLAAQREIQIHCELEPMRVRGDADRMAQVITNLVSNAIEYNRPKGEIRISTRRRGSQATLSVSDTGEGIPKEDLPRIFERFYRADKARDRSNGRSGLGLAICKAIVETHGGTITAQSEIGAGTVFTVSMPLES